MARGYGRRYSKRRKFYKRYGRGRSLRGKVRSIARKVRSIRQTIETKFVEQVFPVQTLSLSATDQVYSGGDTAVPYFFLNSIQEGTEVSQRDGKEVKLTSLDLKFMLRCYDTSGKTSIVRCILFRDRYWDGNVTGNFPYMPQILQNPATGFPRVQSPINWLNRKRFQILRDKIYLLRNENYHGADPLVNIVTNPHKGIWKKWHIKIKQKAKYKSAGSLIDDAAQGALFIMFVTDDTSGVNTVDLGYRLKFQG